MLEDVQYTVLTLKKYPVRVRQLLSDHNIKCSTEIEVWQDHALESMVFQLTAYLACNEKVETRYLEVSATWFDEFKKQYFPIWAIRKWPVKTKLLPYEHKIAVCPHANIA